MRFAGTEMSNYFSTPDFTGLGKTMMNSATMERNMAKQAEGYTEMAGLQSAAKIKGAGFQADAIKAGGQAQGQASMASGLGSMFGGLARGFGSIGSSYGSSSSFSPGSSSGSYASSAASRFL